MSRISWVQIQNYKKTGRRLNTNKMKLPPSTAGQLRSLQENEKLVDGVVNGLKKISVSVVKSTLDAEVGSCHLLKNSGSEVVQARLRAMRYAFGSNTAEHFCKGVKAYRETLMHQERVIVRFQEKHFRRVDYIRTVRFLIRIVKKENLSSSTLHMAVYLMSRYVNRFVIPPRNYWVVVLTCLVIAGKMEEKNSRIPFMEKLRQYIPRGTVFSSALYTQVEREILNFFNWSLLVPNAQTFVEFYMLFAIDDEDFERRQVSSAWEKNEWGPPSMSCVKWVASNLIEILLFAKPSVNYPPSLVAAGVLMISRQIFGFITWPKRLEFITGYSHWQTSSCCENYIRCEIQSVMKIVEEKGLDALECSFLNCAQTFRSLG